MMNFSCLIGRKLLLWVFGTGWGQNRERWNTWYRCPAWGIRGNGHRGRNLFSKGTVTWETPEGKLDGIYVYLYMADADLIYETPKKRGKAFLIGNPLIGYFIRLISELPRWSRSICRFYWNKKETMHSLTKMARHIFHEPALLKKGILPT